MANGVIIKSYTFVCVDVRMWSCGGQDAEI